MEFGLTDNRIARVLTTLGFGLSSGCESGSSVATDDELALPSSSDVRATLLVQSSDVPVIGTTAEVGYELSCSDVVLKSGVIPVPLDGSTISGFFGSILPATDCRVDLGVVLSLEVDLDPDPGVVDTTAACSGSSLVFDVSPGEQIDLGAIEVVCRIDASSQVDFSGFIRLVNRSLDNFFVGPLSIVRDPNTGEVPPIALSLSGPLQSGVDYAWSVVPADGGFFEGCDDDILDCQFFCGSNGTHELVLSANFGDEVLSRDVLVACVVSICGDGKIEAAEECDDSNTESGDGCSDECVVEFCGDSVVNNVSEECDDGNTVSGDGCTNVCVTEVCGDGVANNGDSEECDDGNAAPGDGCSESCVVEFCGDGVVNNGATEQCDDGNTNDSDLCGNDCQVPVCGDGEVEGEEECDLGLGNDGDVCDPDCTLVPNPFCQSCLDDAEPGRVNEDCTTTPECDAVRDCVVDSNCFQTGGDPADCYCGADVAAETCIEPDFVPEGACSAEILAAGDYDDLPFNGNSVLQQIFDPSTTSGRAISLIRSAALFRLCVDECSL